MSRLTARIMAIMLFPLAIFLVGLLSIDQYQCPQDRHWWLLDHLASSGLAAVAAALASLAPTSPGSEVAAPKE